MNKPNSTPCWYGTAAIMALVYPFLATASLANPLDPETHSGNRAYSGDFANKFVPLDASLPWRERFTPDGAFDNRFRIGRETEISNTTELTAPTDSSPGSPNTLDARGVVRDIRSDAGKLKIEHGPIERHGMPPMTMLFNVADPGMTDGISQGDEVEFNVDMDAAGFTITKIRRSEASQ